MSLEIRLASNVFPTLSVTPGGGGTPSNISLGALVKLVQPSITVIENGQQLYHVAPAGEPTTTKLAILTVLAVAGAVLAGYGLVTLLKRYPPL